MIYDAINRPLAALVGDEPSRILDLGCGSGALGKHLKSVASRHVCGVTFSEEEATVARTALDQVIVADLNVFVPPPGEMFDIIICSHVLEHLYEPEQVLRRLHSALRPKGRLIIALPNILFWRQRILFLRGTFRYTEGGLMDSTHFRFFDHVGARDLPIKAGYTVSQFLASGSLPMPNLRKVLPGTITRKIDQWATNRFPGLFGFQFLMVCQKG